jgi:hypothetical protein
MRGPGREVRLPSQLSPFPIPHRALLAHLSAGHRDDAREIVRPAADVVAGDGKEGACEVGGNPERITACQERVCLASMDKSRPAALEPSHSPSA